MKNNPFKVFLIDYICSLSERTRVERNTVKIGFDWLIYRLGLAKRWQPIRLSFYRQSGAGTAKAKTEAEFGIDLSFLLPSSKELYIFVLKDEVLNNKNWTKHDFDTDIRMASSQDLKMQGLEFVSSVKIILAYNKDEDKNGVQLYDQLVATFGTKIGDNVSLSFERWNLTKIVKKVETHLISPELLPQHLYGQFQYICSQVNDFDYGSEEWENQIIPNWRYFLESTLKDPVDERKLRLIPVSLIILFHHRKKSPNSYPGWIDMIEWAMLSVWSCYQRLSDDAKDKILKNIIIEIWYQFYICELERYFMEIEPVLTTQHGFLSAKGAPGASAINDSYLAYWHIGRLGILTLAPQEFVIQEESKHKEFIKKLVNRSADWIIRCIHMNPSVLRPLIDLNHIEIYLAWLILWQVQRDKDIVEWLTKLESRLLVRRSEKNVPIPFIESCNRVDLVIEYVATNERPPEFTDSISYLLLMIMELCFSLGDKERDQLVSRYYKRVIKGIGDDGKAFTKNEIQLTGWVPKEDWSKRILKEKVFDGIAITTNNLESINKNEVPLSEGITNFVDETREKYPWNIPLDMPESVFILACIKHRSPLPPEFWREKIFKVKDNQD